MKHRIARIKPWSAALTLALAYGGLAAVSCLLRFLFGGDLTAIGALSFMAAWIASALLGTMVACGLYNMAAGWTGGIAIELDADPNS